MSSKKDTKYRNITEVVNLPEPDSSAKNYSNNIEYNPTDFKGNYLNSYWGFDLTENIEGLFVEFRRESLFLKYALPIFKYNPLAKHVLKKEGVPEEIILNCNKIIDQEYYIGNKTFTYNIINLIGCGNFKKYGKLITKAFFDGDIDPAILLAETNYPYGVDHFLDQCIRFENYLLNEFVSNFDKLNSIINSYYNPPEFYPNYIDTNYIISRYKHLCHYVKEKEAIPPREDMLFKKVDNELDNLIKTIKKVAKLLGYIEVGGRPSKSYPPPDTLRTEYKKYLKEYNDFVSAKYSKYIYTKSIGENKFTSVKVKISINVYDQMVNEFWLKHFPRQFLDRLPLFYKECNTIPKIVQTILSASHGIKNPKTYMQNLKPII